ncbi:hypothetical protein KCV01_g24445, partial [Aureobasidium melanogenum]
MRVVRQCRDRRHDELAQPVPNHDPCVGIAIPRIDIERDDERASVACGDPFAGFIDGVAPRVQRRDAARPQLDPPDTCRERDDAYRSLRSGVAGKRELGDRQDHAGARKLAWTDRCLVQQAQPHFRFAWNDRAGDRSPSDMPGPDDAGDPGRRHRGVHRFGIVAIHLVRRVPIRGHREIQGRGYTMQHHDIFIAIGHDLEHDIRIVGPETDRIGELRIGVPLPNDGRQIDRRHVVDVLGTCYGGTDERKHRGAIDEANHLRHVAAISRGIQIGNVLVKQRIRRRGGTGKRRLRIVDPVRFGGERIQRQADTTKPALAVQPRPVVVQASYPPFAQLLQQALAQ